VQARPQQQPGQAEHDEAAGDGVGQQHPEGVDAHRHVQPCQRADGRRVLDVGLDEAVADVELGRHAAPRRVQLEGPARRLLHVAIGPAHRGGGLGLDARLQRVEPQLGLQPARHRVGRVEGAACGQRDLHRAQHGLLDRDLQDGAMVEQDARRAEQQAQHGTPQAHIEMDAPQPDQERRLAAATATPRRCRHGRPLESDGLVHGQKR
jgi:hypothetical protein